MYTIKITYKSGKIEIVKLPLSEYTNALTSLTREGRLVKFEILI